MLCIYIYISMYIQLYIYIYVSYHFTYRPIQPKVYSVYSLGIQRLVASSRQNEPTHIGSICGLLVVCQHHSWLWWNPNPTTSRMLKWQEVSSTSVGFCLQHVANKFRLWQPDIPEQVENMSIQNRSQYGCGQFHLQTSPITMVGVVSTKRSSKNIKLCSNMKKWSNSSFRFIQQKHVQHCRLPSLTPGCEERNLDVDVVPKVAPGTVSVAAGDAKEVTEVSRI